MIWKNTLDRLESIGFGYWVSQLTKQCDDWLVGHGDYPRWRRALDTLPGIRGAKGVFSESAVTVTGECDDEKALRMALTGLSPWRKGPFDVSGITIDSEWRSDLKWERVSPYLASLTGRRILDVGCGNGYYAWRMLDQNPALVLGIEPSVLFNLQFQALQKYIRSETIHLLPLGVQDMPPDLAGFDTVFSMGVLYHRRSPIDHLYQLREFLVEGGELCLETLVIDGKAGEVLVPEGRYARMRNVWFIPSIKELIRWLKRCGFVDVRVVDQNRTSTTEQRTTQWMQFESLAQALDSDDATKTVEGLPAPQRAVVLAKKP